MADTTTMLSLRRRYLRLIRNAVVFLVACALLWLTSGYGYLLFHSIVEIISIAIAVAVFMISWSSRGYPETQPFVILGIGYLFVAGLDLLHVLSYRGMNVLPPGIDDATKLWVAARGLQALVSLAFVILIRAGRTAPSPLAFLLVGGVAVALALSIFLWDVFPLSFVEGQGVTLFKKLAEYGIAAVLAVSVVLLAPGAGAMSRWERLLLGGAFALNAASELVFTLYVSAYGYQNLLGHLMKLGSFALAYQALFASKVRSRLALIEELKSTTDRLARNERALRSANFAKDKFISILAHDLRNPISGILNISELLSTRFDAVDPARVRELIRLVHEGARESTDLLENLLQWGRAQSGRLQVRPASIPLAELCGGIAALHRPAASAKGVTLESCVPPESRAWADEQMMATVLRNLLSNAVKFTGQGGRVAVSAAAAGDRQRITVSDSGCGMMPDDIAKLFRIDVHYSCPGTAGEHGAGMGLILVNELVTLNKGTIEVKSEPARGTVFTVSLPAAAPRG
jgi:signal transduction histidine kinase